MNLQITRGKAIAQAANLTKVNFCLISPFEVVNFAFDVKKTYNIIIIYKLQWCQVSPFEP